MLLLELLDIKQWGEIAQIYKQDPADTRISGEMRTRFMFLDAGDDLALIRPAKEFTTELLAELQQKKADADKCNSSLRQS